MRDSAYFRDEKAPIAIARIGSHAKTSSHDHEFHELVLVLKGSGVHFTDDESYPIYSGDVFLIPPGYKHGYCDTSELDLVNILYSKKLMGVPEFDIKDIPGYHLFFELEPGMRRVHEFKSRLTLSSGKLIECESIVTQIEKELESGKAGSDFMAVSLLMRLQCLIARSYNSNPTRKGEALIRLADVVAFIERNHSRGIRLEELAKVANMSRSTLNRSFLEATGLSPVEYLIRTRILKGAELLREKRGNVSDVAFAVGFKDSNYFSRQFRRVMGEAPGRYGRGSTGEKGRRGEHRTSNIERGAVDPGNT